MKKYNLSEIMKRAWELVKKAGMTISASLRKAWQEAKRTMKGSEKQIAWATDIVGTIQNIFHDAEKAQANHPMIEKVKEMHSRIIENMMNGNAGEIIDDFKGICRHEGKALEDYRDVINLIAVVEMTQKRNYRK